MKKILVAVLLSLPVSVFAAENCYDVDTARPLVIKLLKSPMSTKMGQASVVELTVGKEAYDEGVGIANSVSVWRVYYFRIGRSMDGSKVYESGSALVRKDDCVLRFSA